MMLLILMLDGTQLTTYFGDKKAWPIYLTIGNISQNFCRKPNCNVMITGPIDYGLHVVLSRQFHLWPTRGLSTSSFILHRLRYELFFTPSHRCYNLISLVPTWPPISTSSFWSRSPTRCRLLADQRLSSWWWWSEGEFLTFYKGKPLRGATSEVVRETAGRTRPGLTLGTSTSASTIHHTTR